LFPNNLCEYSPVPRSYFAGGNHDGKSALGRDIITVDAENLKGGGEYLGTDPQSESRGIDLEQI
jgi:hypothetical protein